MSKEKIINIITIGMFYLLFSFAKIFAQDIGLNLSTPFRTINLFKENIQKENYKPEIAIQALNMEGINKSEYLDLLDKFRKILIARVLKFNLEQVPDDSNYIDEKTKLNRFYPFSNESFIYLEKFGNKWLFSKQTVKTINEEYEKTFPFQIDKLIIDAPEWLKYKFLGIALWQYLGLIVYILLCFLLFNLFQKLLSFLLDKILIKIKYSEIITHHTKQLSMPISLLILLALFSLFVPELHLPLNLGIIINYIIKALIPLFITILAIKFTNLLFDIFQKIATKTKTKLDDNLLPLARKALKIIIIITGLIFILQNLDINITPFIAGASIGGLAFALAAQETIRNFFGSITIFADHPFEIGDWIVFDGKEGVVEEIGVRSTRIRTFYNSLITVPNGKLADMVIDNMGVRKYRRFRTMISITYDTPTELINVFTDGIKEIIKMHPNTYKDYYIVQLNEFSSSSLDILLNIFFEVPDMNEETRCRHEIMTSIIDLAKELGVRFAFPTSTIHIEEFPEKKSLTPNYSDNKEGFMKKMAHFFDKRKEKS